MKTIRELRTVLRFHPEEINSSIQFFAENCNIDFEDLTTKDLKRVNQKNNTLVDWVNS